MSKRYNRIVKRSLIDISEQDAIARIAALNEQLQRQVAEVRTGLDGLTANLVANVRKVSFGKERGQILRTPKQFVINKTLRYDGTRFESIHPAFFDSSLKDVFFIDGPIANVWRRGVRLVMDTLAGLDRLFSTEASPHVRILQSAIGRLSAEQEQVILTASGSGTLTQAIAAESRARAERLIGVPFPHGERRSKLEALESTIQLRLELAKLANKVADELVKGPPQPRGDNPRTRQAMVDRFHVLTWVLLRSCVRDADLCHDMCGQANARRLDLGAVLISMRARFDLARYRAERQIRTAELPKLERIRAADLLLKDRDIVMPAAANKIAQIVGTDGTAGLDNPFNTWTKQTIRPKWQEIFDQWGVAVETLRSGGFYTPVRQAEKEEIARAVVLDSWGFGGRFYQCPYGHAYTIGNCGQAMEESQCLECGAPIGGEHHQLRADNTRDTEMERLAREGGAQANPWAR